MGVCPAKELVLKPISSIYIAKNYCKRVKKVLYRVSVEDLLSIFHDKKSNNSIKRKLSNILVSRRNFNSWEMTAFRSLFGDNINWRVYPVEQHVESNQYLSTYIWNGHYNNDFISWCFVFIDEENIKELLDLLKELGVKYKLCT